MLAAVYSSIFFATPVLVDLKEQEPKFKLHKQRVLARRAAGLTDRKLAKAAPRQPATAGSSKASGGKQASGKPASGKAVGGKAAAQRHRRQGGKPRDREFRGRKPDRGRAGAVAGHACRQLATGGRATAGT